MKKILSFYSAFCSLRQRRLHFWVLCSIQQHRTNAITNAADLLFGISSSESLNWAGYAVTGSNIVNVSGSFIVPSYSGQSSSAGPKSGHQGGGPGGGSTTSYAAFWAGIDGYNSNTVEQAGVLMEVQKRSCQLQCMVSVLPCRTRVRKLGTQSWR